jgi:hypothetical protein
VQQQRLKLNYSERVERGVGGRGLVVHYLLPKRLMAARCWADPVPYMVAALAILVALFATLGRDVVVVLLVVSIRAL